MLDTLFGLPPTAVDDVERAALVDLHAAASPALRRRLGLRAVDIGGALASVVARDPAIVLNRACGLGLAFAAREEHVARLRAAYDAAGVGRHFVQLHPDAGPPSLRPWLRRAGYGPQRRWMKFERDTSAPPAPRTDLAVREIGRGHAAEFGRIAAEGFDLSEAGGAWVAALAGRPRWRLFMSFDGDRPVGTGALFVHGSAGWLDWGATTRDARGRGGQSALLARRIAAARSLGCRTLFTTTGEWVEGDPQHSYRNIRRAGFRELFLEENWAPFPSTPQSGTMKTLAAAS